MFLVSWFVECTNREAQDVDPVTDTAIGREEKKRKGAASTSCMLLFFNLILSLSLLMLYYVKF